MAKHTSAGFKLWAICTPSGVLIDFEPCVMSHEGLKPRNAMITMCKSLPNSNYRLWADNLFVTMATIKSCYELPQQVFLYGTV